MGPQIHSLRPDLVDMARGYGNHCAGGWAVMLINTRERLKVWGYLCTNEVDLGPRPMKMEVGRVRSMPPLAELPADIREVDEAVRRIRADFRRLLIVVYCYRGSNAEKAERMGLHRKTFWRRLVKAESAVDSLISN